jgi:hypothetical protein
MRAVFARITDEDGIGLKLGSVASWSRRRDGGSRPAASTESVHPSPEQFVGELDSIALPVDHRISPPQEHHESRVERSGSVRGPTRRALHQIISAFSGPQEEPGEPTRQIASERQQIPRAQQIEEAVRGRTIGTLQPVIDLQNFLFRDPVIASLVNLPKS